MPSRIDYKYPRIKTSVENQKILKASGYTPVFSSNVSAIQRSGADLYIRFHNGVVYQYPRKGKDYGSLLTSASKGKWVWANLRKTNAPYNRVGNFPLDGDVDLTTEQMMERVSQQSKLDVLKEMITAKKVSTIKKVAQSTLVKPSVIKTLEPLDILKAVVITTLVVNDKSERNTTKTDNQSYRL